MKLLPWLSSTRDPWRASTCSAKAITERFTKNRFLGHPAIEKFSIHNVKSKNKVFGVSPRASLMLPDPARSLAMTMRKK
jgi:hypothetical protein